MISINVTDSVLDSWATALECWRLLPEPRKWLVRYASQAMANNSECGSAESIVSALAMTTICTLDALLEEAGEPAGVIAVAFGVERDAKK